MGMTAAGDIDETICGQCIGHPVLRRGQTIALGGDQLLQHPGDNAAIFLDECHADRCLIFMIQLTL